MTVSVIEAKPRLASATPFIILVIHGSRDPRPARLAQHLSQDVQTQLHQRFALQACVAVTSLELNEESLAEQIIRLATSQPESSCQILPLFLLPGAHVRDDIPHEVAIAQASLGDAVTLQVQPYLGSQPKMQALLRGALDPDCQWILLAHGSRRAGANQSVAQLAATINATPAYWASQPDFKTVVAELIRQGHRRLGILPYFLFPGGISDTVAGWIEELRLHYPAVDFQLSVPLCQQPGFLDLVLESLASAAM